MRQDVNATVAPAEKRAQEPADKRDNDRTEDRAPKTVHLETRHDFTDQLQHERINDQNKKAERHQDERNTKKEQNRPDKRVDDAEQERRAKQATDSGVTKSHDVRCYEDGESGDEPAKNKMPHGSRYYDFSQRVASSDDRAKAIQGGISVVAKKNRVDDAGSDKIRKTKSIGRTTKAKKAARPKKLAIEQVEVKSASVPVTAFDPTDEQIQTRAYFISERRRRFDLPGDANTDWLEAKRQLLAETRH